MNMLLYQKQVLDNFQNFHANPNVKDQVALPFGLQSFHIKEVILFLGIARSIIDQFAERFIACQFSFNLEKKNWFTPSSVKFLNYRRVAATAALGIF
jgi:hypothetical protein